MKLRFLLILCALLLASAANAQTNNCPYTTGHLTCVQGVSHGGSLTGGSFSQAFPSSMGAGHALVAGFRICNAGCSTATTLPGFFGDTSNGQYVCFMLDGIYDGTSLHIGIGFCYLCGTVAGPAFFQMSGGSAFFVDATVEEISSTDGAFGPGCLDAQSGTVPTFGSISAGGTEAISLSSSTTHTHDLIYSYTYLDVNISANNSFSLSQITSQNVGASEMQDGATTAVYTTGWHTSGGGGYGGGVLALTPGTGSGSPSQLFIVIPSKYSVPQHPRHQFRRTKWEAEMFRSREI